MPTWLTVVLTVFSSSITLEFIHWVVSKKRRANEKNLFIKALPQKIDDLDRKMDNMQSAIEKDGKHFAKIDATLSEMQEALNLNAEGTAIGLENDLIIFNAFRDHHINGESEKAEKKVRDYLMASAKKTLKVDA